MKNKVSNSSSFLPMVSIIMPCKNAELTIAQAIESVIEQNYLNLELIIIDDGSDDTSFSIIKSFSINHSFIKLLINKTPGRGVWYARNIGLEQAKGRFIVFLDSDDYLLPQSIISRVNFALYKNAKVVYGPYLRLGFDGKLSLVKAKNKISFTNMLTKNHIGNLTGMYDSTFFKNIRQTNIPHEDYLMWAEMIKKIDYAYSVGKEPIAVYRVSNNSLSSNKLKSFFWHWNVLRNGLNIPLIPAIFFQALYLSQSIYMRIKEKF